MKEEKIEPVEEKEVRSRIRELFSEELLIQLESIQTDPRFLSNNDKFKYILFLLKDLGFVEIGAGTNRMAVLHGKYIYKIALDTYGVKDNWNEFDMSPELQPYVTKSYECNGIVLVAEYVNLLNQEEFLDSKDNIRSILDVLSYDYLFSDIGTISKNFCNFGYRDDNSIVILDYGYIYPIDRKIMFCESCSSKLIWNTDYSELVCSSCGKKYHPVKIKYRMDVDEKDYLYYKKDDTDTISNDKPLKLKVNFDKSSKKDGRD